MIDHAVAGTFGFVPINDWADRGSQVTARFAWVTVAPRQTRGS